MIASHKRMSAAAAACLIAGIAGLFAFFVLGDGSVTIAFADVRKQIQEAQSLVFDMTYMPTEGGEPHRLGKVMFKDPGLIRFESHSGDVPTTAIINTRKAKILSFNPKTKTAVLVDWSSDPETPLMKGKTSGSNAGQIVQYFKELVGGSDKPLGQKMIDGKKALGFRATKDKNSANIWIDKEVGDILVVEIDFYENKATLVLRNIQVNKTLDDSLFSLTPPEGYKLIQESPIDITDQPSDARDNTEKDLIEGLRLYAKCQMGKFPPEPNKGDLTFFVGLNAKGEYVLTINLNKNFFSGRLDKVKKRGMQAFHLFKRCRSVIADLKKTKTWKYVGENIKLGDAQKPICWYRPEGSTTYRVVYGDLSVKDVKPEDLPKEPEETKEPE